MDPAFSRGDNMWSPGIYTCSAVPRSMVVNFYDEHISYPLPINFQDHHNVYNAGRVVHNTQFHMPIAFSPSTVRYSMDFPVFPSQNTAVLSSPLQEEPMYDSRVQDFSNEDTCISCSEARKQLLIGQVCDLVKEHGFLEVSGKELLGWYMMLAAKDRKIIKEAGQLREFLQDIPSLAVDNNWVKLKDTSACEKMEEKSTSLNILNTSRHPTFYCSWSCENCGFSNRLNVLTCKQCHSTMKAFEQNATRLDCAFEPTNSDTSFLSENDSVYGSSSSIEFKSSTIEADKTYHINKAEEICSNVEPVNEFVCIAMQKHTLRKSADVIQPPETESYEDEEFCRSFESPNVLREALGEKHLVDLAAESIYDEDHVGLIERHLREGKQILSHLQQNVIDHLIVPDRSENFDDSGIKDDLMFSTKELLLDSERPIGVQDQHECAWLDEEPVTPDCSVSDINDDTFYSLKSGSFSSSLDYLDHIDTENFFDEVKDFPGYSLYNPFGPPEHLQSANVGDTVYPSIDIKNKMSKAVNTDLSTILKSVRDVSCVTDLSDLIRHEKESQTMSVDTRDVFVNTDITIPETFTDPQPVTSSRDRDKNQCTGLGIDSSSIKALTQRAVKAELHVLNTQFWLCRQLCWKHHHQSMEKQCIFDITKVQEEQVETTANLQSSLAELEEKYKNMKTLIISGVPLDTMTPLSLQLTQHGNPSLISNPSGTSSISHFSDGLPHWERLLLYGCVSETLPTNKDNEESKRLTDGHIHVTQEMSDTQNIHGALDTYARSPLPVDTSGNPKPDEDDGSIVDVNEEWIDAEETLNVYFPRKQECQVIPEPRQSEPPSEQNKSYVCVRNIALSINEAEFISHFQNYHVSSVFFQELCKKSSYAILTFKSLEHAEAAVKEMNGKELSGRSIKVHLIKDAKHDDSFKGKPLQKFSEAQSSATQFSNSESLDSRLNHSPNNRMPSSDKVPVTRSGCLPVSASSKLGSVLYTMHRGHTMSPSYPMQIPHAAPTWTSHNTPSFVPFIPPWMMQSVVTKWTAYNSTPSPLPISYSGPPFWMPTTSTAPWDPVSSQQAFRVKAKPVTNRSRHVPDSKVKCRTFNKDLNIPAAPAQPKFDTCINSANFDFRSPNAFTQTGTVPLGSKSNTLYSETNSTAAKETFNMTTVGMAGVSYAASFSSPRSISTPRTSVTYSVFPTSEKSMVSPSVTGCGIKAVSEPSNINGGTATSQLIKPTPEKVLSGPCDNGVGPVTSSTSTALPFSTKLFGGTSCPNLTTDAPKPTPSQSVSEDWSIGPRLDPSTELSSYIIPNRLTLYTFNKAMKHLIDLHPEATRDYIFETIKEVKNSKSASLHVLSFAELVSMVSLMLASKSSLSRTT